MLRFIPSISRIEEPTASLPEAPHQRYAAERLVLGLITVQALTKPFYPALLGFALLMLTRRRLTGPLPESFDDQPDRRAWARALR